VRILRLIFARAVLSGGRSSIEGEERKKEKWHGVGCRVGRSMGQIWYYQ
jgi:hypothetical protein